MSEGTADPLPIPAQIWNEFLQKVSSDTLLPEASKALQEAEKLKSELFSKAVRKAIGMDLT